MKKLIIGGIIILTFTVGIAGWLLFDEPKVFLSTKSPTGIYVVELIGDKTRPTFPYMNHFVSFNLFKDGHQIVKNEEVHHGDLFDSDFNELFPEHKWVNDSILRFGLSNYKSENSADSITISNKTNKIIKYLKINADDKIFVFGMLPNSTINLPLPHLRNPPYVTAEGEFENGQPIEHKGVNFFGGEETPLKYCLSVINNSIRIENTSLTGYTRDHTNPDVPKVTNCF